MRCPNCGNKDLAPDAKSCNSCGHSLDLGTPAEHLRTTISSSVSVTNQTGGTIAATQIAQISGDVQVEGGATLTGPMINPTFLVSGYLTPPEAKQVQTPPGSRFPLFGRAAETKEVIAALRRGKTTLLYGMAGIGKTALAVAAAQRLHGKGRFTAGVLWLNDIDAAPAEAVCDAIARQLGDEGIPKLAAADKPAAIRRLLNSRPLLLVLDNLARLETASALLDYCLPVDLPVLATSREHHPLFEVDLELKPLDATASAALFQARSRIVDSDGRMGNICALLEGHPLAIVIAAARARAEAMPLASLQKRLVDEKTRLGELVLDESEKKELNVRASLRLSYDQLNGDERLVLTTLAACFGDTTGLDLLAQVCGLDVATCEEHLGRLLFHSLAARSQGRCSLHRLVRDFGRRELGDTLDGVQKQVMSAALQYAGRYAEMTSENHDRLEAELSNLLGAARFAYEEQSWQEVCSFRDALGDFLYQRGYWSEAIQVGLWTFEAAGRLQDFERQAWGAMYPLVRQYFHQGNYAEAERWCRQAIELFQRVGHHQGLAAADRYLGRSLQAMGDLDGAEAMFKDGLQHIEKALLAPRKSVDRIIIDKGNLVAAIAGLEQARGQTGQAREGYDAALQLYRQVRDSRGIATMLHRLGDLEAAEGHWDEAERFFKQALEIVKDNWDDHEASLIHALGLLAEKRGDLESARILLLDASRRFAALPDTPERMQIEEALARLGDGAVSRREGTT